ncbi:MAG: TonB-dependent receptor [Desulfobulbaceae bacterium]|nr:TonB-dependent receptor [Desulfobulbaceae bacterium]
MAGALCILTEIPALAVAEKNAAQDASVIDLGKIEVSAARDSKEEKPVPMGSYAHEVTSSDRARTSDTAALLYDVPGVSLQQNGGVSSLPFLHGLGDDRIRIKVDGMDLISACPNHMNSPLSYIDPSNVNAMSVVAGITPVSMGGDSIGGSIVVNSPAPEFAKPGAAPIFTGTAGAFYRSNGNGAGANLSTTAASEYFSLRYSGSVAQSANYHSAKDFKAAGPAAVDRGWLDGDEVGSSSYKSWNHAAVVGWHTDNHLLQLNLGIQEIPYEGFPTQRMDMTDNYSEQINLSYTGQYSWGTLDARLYNDLTKHEMDFADDKQYFYGSASTILAPGMPMNTEGRNTGLVVKGEIQLSERDLLKTGIEGQRYRLDDWWPPSPSVLPAGYTVGGMAPDTFWNINNGKRDRLALFAEWEAQWNPRLLSQLGVRSDTVMMDTGTVHGYNTMMYNGAPLFPATAFNNRDRQRTDYNYDATALARYTPDAPLAVELGYSRKTRSPNLYERYSWSVNMMAMEMINFNGDGNYYVGNLDLKPEVANTFSITTDFNDDKPEHWGLKITPYYTSVQDYIDVRRCPTSVCGDKPSVQANLTASQGFVSLQFVNVDAQLYGVDVSGHVQLANTEAFGSFTASGLINYVQGENKTTDDNLYNIMPLNAKVAVSHRLGGLTSTVEGQFVDAKTQVSSVRDEVKTAGYGLMNLRSSYEWRSIRLDVGVDNALNKQYDLPLGGAYVGQGPTMSGSAIPWGVPVPGMGRSLYAAINITF